MKLVTDSDWSIADRAHWHGGRALHAIYRSRLPVISPWARGRLSNRSYERDLVPVAELTDAFSRSLDWLVDARGGPVDGAYLEFGVCTGSSIIALHRALAARDDADLDLIGFDSFEGLPDDAPDHDDGVWKAGSFMSDRERTEHRLASLGIEAELVVGWFSDTLNDATRRHLQLDSAPLVMIDCDVYSAAAEALSFTVPHLTGPSVVVFDDWHSCDLAERGMGEAKAWAETLAANPAIRVVDELPAYNENSHVVAIDVATG